jgi:hypothetical protein
MFWRSTHSDRPLLASWRFINGGIHVTLDPVKRITIPVCAKHTLRITIFCPIFSCPSRGPGDHLWTCTVHSVAKKAHDWVVDQIADFFRTTHKVKTQQVVRSRGQWCGDIELTGYLANTTGPVPLVLDLRITHERWGSSSDPSISGHLHYPNDIDRPLNETSADKIRSYRTDYNNRALNTISFIPAIVSSSGRLHSEFVRLLLLQAHRKTDRFVAASGVQLPKSISGQFHYRRVAFSSQVKSKIGNILTNGTVPRIVLNIDGEPVASKSDTHLSPWHSQTSRLLTSSVSLGVPVPRGTQCMRVE